MKRFWDSTRAKVNYTEFLNTLLVRNGRWSEVADAKSGVILVFLTAGIKAVTGPSVKTLQKIGANLNIYIISPLAVFTALFCLCLLVAVGSSLYALAHTFLTLQPVLHRKRKPGYVFFGDIATQDFAEFASKMPTLTEEEINSSLVEQVYTTAQIARQKHTHVQQAINGLFAAVISGLSLYVMSLQ